MATDLIRVAVVRTGGFGGLSRSGALDTRELTTAQARELAGLLDAVDLDALAGSSSRGSTGPPDAFRYELSVSRRGRRWDLSLSDPEVPDELRPVIRLALQSPGTTQRAGPDRPSAS